MCNAIGQIALMGDGSLNIGLTVYRNIGVFGRYVTGLRDGYVTSSNTNNNYGISFSLSNSNSIFGRSNTVTPSSRRTQFMIRY